MNKKSITLTVTNQALIVRYEIDTSFLSGHLVRYLNKNRLFFDVSGH